MKHEIDRICFVCMCLFFLNMVTESSAAGPEAVPKACVSTAAEDPLQSLSDTGDISLGEVRFRSNFTYPVLLDCLLFSANISVNHQH